VTVAPRACVCGRTHQVNTAVIAAIGQRGEHHPILTPHGAWRVPRVYSASHDIRGASLVLAAARYGFPRVT
jgi:hypothetical protein